MVHVQQQKLIWRFFEGRLASRRSRPLLAHVAECDACRSEFEEAQLAYRALGGRTDTTGLTRAESELIEAAVLGARPERRLGRRALASALVAAAAAAALLVAWPRRGADQLTAR